MKLSLLIATTNLHRRKMLTSIINDLFPEITIDKDEIRTVNISPESGIKAQENVIEKVKFYRALFGKNVLCEDDTLIINGNEISPNRERDKVLSKLQVFEHWEKFLKLNGNVKGEITKAFALYTQTGILEDKIEMKIKLQLPKRKPNKIIINPLNYFIIPKGYVKPLSEFNNVELDLYREKEKILLKNLLVSAFYRK